MKFPALLIFLTTHKTRSFHQFLQLLVFCFGFVIAICSYLQNNRNYVKNDHCSVELTPSVKNVGVITVEELFYFDFCYHLNSEHQCADQVAYVRECHDVFVLLECFRGIGTYWNETEQSTRSNDTLDPFLKRNEQF